MVPHPLHVKRDSFISEDMNASDVRAMLAQQIKEAGSAAAWCRKHDVRAVSVSATMLGRIDPPPQVLKALGLVKIVTYEFDTKPGRKPSRKGV